MSVDQKTDQGNQPVAVKQVEADQQDPNSVSTSTAQGKVSSSETGEKNIWEWVKEGLQLNPMNGLISSFRAALLGHELPWKQLGYSAMAVLVIFISGSMYFYRLEPKFADII